MAVTDNSGAEVIHLERPMRCTGCCCFCCLQEMEVQSPPGTIIGYVKQKLVSEFSVQDLKIFCSCTLWAPQFTIQNESGDSMLLIKGPCCTCQFCADIEFQVMHPQKRKRADLILTKCLGDEC